MGRLVGRLLVTVAVTTGMIVATAGIASAGPSSAPNFGIVDPQRNNPNTHIGPFTGTCPWPDFIDQFIPEVEKCMPSKIAWTTDGVRIVSDPLVGADGAWGAFTFWCQSRVGLHYIVTVHGLAPNMTYPVTADGFGQIGSLRTDPAGNGVTGGMVRLDPGVYDWVVRVGSALVTVTGDEIGFEVF